MTTTNSALIPPHSPLANLGRCARCSAQLEHGDLRCAVCAFTVPERRRGEGGGDGDGAHHESLKVFRCKGCGAATSWSAEKKAVACAFCNDAVALEEIADPVEQTEAWLPFVVDASRAKSALKTWLKSLGWFRPSDLASASTVDNMKAMWWPAWIFDARARATWAADSNAGSGRAAWAPHAGDAELAFERIVVGCSRGLSEGEMNALASAYDLAPATSTRPSGQNVDDSVLEETFDAQRSAAREKVARACAAVADDAIRNGHIPGNRYRNVHVSLVLSELITRRVALPAWVVAYRYGGKLYRVVVHGQDPSRVVGDAPRSFWKIFALVAGIAVAAGIGIAIYWWLSVRPR